MTSDQPLPQISDDALFWEAASEHELRMQQCDSCGHVRWPPGPVCPECWAEPHSWTELSGRGQVNTWVVYHREYFPAFAADIPYNVAEVELDEGPRYLANVVQCDNDELHRGMSVEVIFEDVSDEVALPKFRPV